MSQVNSNVESVHYNLPQLFFAAAMCRRNFLLWGRRTGKSNGALADFSLCNVHAMPRSNGFAVGTTYTQLLSRTLPPLIAGWERLGYKENVHFWIRKYAPEKLNLPKAYSHPISAEHYIHWFNGTGIYLVSQDRPGTINGVATQWGFGDEAKFLDKEKLDEEVLLTLSGGYDKWGDLWNYLSTAFSSDMPTNASARWLIDAKNDFDPEAVSLLVAMAYEIQLLEDKLLGDYTELTKGKIQQEINRLHRGMNELKKNVICYSEASTIDNIHALGLDVIKNFFRQLDPLTFLTSVLNEFQAMIENCFYASLNPHHHGYVKENYNYIDSLIEDIHQFPERDCRWDDDLLKHQPLYIACDYNNAINSVVTGQLHDYVHERCFVSSMYVKNPDLLTDLVLKWSKYYEFHQCKEVFYVYDQTAIGGKADTDISYADMWMSGLRDAGWSVIPVYIGEAPRHRARHYLFNQVAREKDPRLPAFRYNRENCKSWQVSCERAGIVQTGHDKRDFRKDKRSERSMLVPAEESTHLSEAGDILFWYMFNDYIKDDVDFMDTVIF